MERKLPRPRPSRSYLTTAFQYDAAGNVTKVIDPKAQEPPYAYSSLSELTAVTLTCSPNLVHFE